MGSGRSIGPVAFRIVFAACSLAIVLALAVGSVIVAVLVLACALVLFFFAVPMARALLSAEAPASHRRSSARAPPTL